MPAHSVLSRLADRFAALRGSVKIFIFAIPAASLIAFLALAPGSGEGEWVCLADGKDAALSDQIRQKLAQKGIAVETRDRAVRVRRQDQSRAVMTLAGEGVLGDAELFRFLEESNFTSTHWQLDKRWQVALQRKLERMIRELDSIQEAYVQITPGSEARTLGVRDAEGGKASVVVMLKPGRSELAPSEIQGIAHLVSAGVKGLKPDGVKIMDRLGHLYRVNPDDGRWSNVSDRHALERRYEKDLEEKAQRVMASFYPQATVSAFVKLSSRRIIQRETQVAPEGAAKVLEEASVNSSGMKGIKSLAVPELPPVEGAAHETRRQVEIEPGEIEHASMAVAIPMDPAPQNFSAEEERIRRLIQNATGIEDADISVQAIPAVHRGPDEPPAAVPAPPTEVFPAVPAALGAAVVLLAIFAFATRRPRRVPDPLAPLRQAAGTWVARSPDEAVLRLRSIGPRQAAVLLSALDAESMHRILSRLDKAALEGLLQELVRIGQAPLSAAEIKSALSCLSPA